MSTFPNNTVSAETLISIRTDGLELDALEEFVRSCRANGIPGNNRIHVTRIGHLPALKTIVDIPVAPVVPVAPEPIPCDPADPISEEDRKIQAELDEADRASKSWAASMDKVTEAASASRAMGKDQLTVSAAEVASMSYWWWMDKEQWFRDNRDGNQYRRSGDNRISAQSAAARGWTRIPVVGK